MKEQPYKVQAYLNKGEQQLLDELMKEWRVASISEAIGRAIYEAHKHVVKK